MHDHAEAEHQDDRVHLKGDGVRSVQDIENTVIAEIDNQRIDGIVARFAQADEDVVDDGTPRISDIEGRKFYDDGKYLIRISEILRITEEGRPGGNCGRPKHYTCGGNEVVIELPQFFVAVLAVRADDLGKCGDRNQQPAP